MPAKGRYAPAGKEWFGVLCANPLCGMPIFIGEVLPKHLDREGTLTIRGEDQKLTCPTCQTESVYPFQQLKRFQTVDKAKLS